MKQFHPSQIRKTILNMAYAGSTVHIGCAFSIVELLAVLYRSHLRFNRADPDWAGRDYLVLSKGHGVMAQYACLNEIGWIGAEELAGYFGNGSRLKGLADTHVPGVEATTGSLGHGLSVAVGLALGAKRNGTDQRCYSLVGDGELNEGTIWEAAMFASQFKLDNLVVVVDVNGFQAMGRTDEIIGLGDIEAKFKSFGFDSIAIDGHDELAIDRAFAQCQASNNGRPKAVVAKTIKGKGVPFMENNNAWHYTRLNAETFEAAISALEVGT
jgi:transketolase